MQLTQTTTEETTLSAPPSLVSCQELCIGYQQKPLLPPLELDIQKGQFWGIFGPNGSGKTTLFRTLLGLLNPVSGKIETSQHQEEVVYIPQHSHFDALLPLRVRDVVALGLERGWSFLRPWRTRDEKQQVLEALTSVGAEEWAERPFSELSGGQQQRVLIARALVSRPSLMFLDEPTASLDPQSERELLRLLNKLRKEHHFTIIMISHHLQMALGVVDHLMILEPGIKTVLSGTKEELLSHPELQNTWAAFLCNQETIAHIH